MPKAPGKLNWTELMRIALAQARIAAAAGEIPVGALIVSAPGKILAIAANNVEKACNPCGHAELLAIQQACMATGHARLEGCILVSTLEPCLMCAGALFHAHLQGIVYGAEDRLAGAINSQADFLQLPSLAGRSWSMGGILAQDCAELLNNFFKSMRKA